MLFTAETFIKNPNLVYQKIVDYINNKKLKPQETYIDVQIQHLMLPNRLNYEPAESDK